MEDLLFTDINEGMTMIESRNLGGGSSEFGVHIKYDDLWFAMVYLAAIYSLGYLGQKFLLMPALVGQIFAGIIMGPSLLDVVPYPEAFVLFGEIGLVMLVIEAGVDIDVMTLKVIGPRGVIIATLGSVFPIVFGFVIALALGADITASIAAGAAFGPTSLGIAMNILRTGKIINTPTGQLIVAAAIIDDMIALIILSQLSGLAGVITVKGVLVPVVSALAFLVVGGYFALFYLPEFLDSFILSKLSEKNHGKMALFIMLALVLGLMQATHYSEASHLMGAFIAGLVFCTDHHLHVQFVGQFKRILQWLMRIFFASTIGFQVPIKNFGSGKVIWQGLVFTLALLGKIGVGFLVPNFTQSGKFRGNHLRDCLIVGCSMAAEGEFAFVIAAFSIDKGLIEPDLYSSIVLAILLSTILAPFSLRYTISYFNKRAMEEIENVEQSQRDGDVEDQLKATILEGKAAFFCINTTSHAAWGTLPRLMQSLFELDLEIIDHRSWHSKFEDTCVNEVYAKGLAKHEEHAVDMVKQINDKIVKSIDQSDAVIRVTRWFPGILDNFVGEETDHSDSHTASEISKSLLDEAQKKLDKSQHFDSTKEDLLKGSTMGIGSIKENENGASTVSESLGESVSRPGKKIRFKTVSTPAVGGGDLFTPPVDGPLFQPAAPVRPRRRVRTLSTPMSGDMFNDTSSIIVGAGEVVVTVTGPKGEKYMSKMKTSTFDKLGSGNPLTLVELQQSTTFEGEYLEGFVRRSGRARSVSNLSWTAEEKTTDT